ncbi:MarR family winged helix-turn-helix transcriptional regulator [Alkalihalophilus sp. As8PL]|uniref:MarR family winged helix-turn-helix transcriptional regulator n=1 Tax=Alkalihalophilus sp. As8PL TaxID=3237103 RepID=A0AB39BUN8_9BACI
MSLRQLDNRVGYHIGLVAHQIHNQYNQKLAEFELTVAQARVLYLLAYYGAQTQVELQKRLFVKGSTMNGVIDSLLKKDFIKKVNSDVDKRAKYIHLSSKGEAIEGELWEEMNHLESNLMIGFSDEEKALLLSWLKKVEGNIQCESLKKEDRREEE